MFEVISANYEPRPPRGNPVFYRAGVRARIGYGSQRGGIAKNGNTARRRQSTFGVGFGRGSSGRCGRDAFGVAESGSVHGAAAR